MVAVAFLSVSVVAAEPPRTALPAYWIATMTVTNPEAFAKEFVRKDAGLWEAVHAAANFLVGISGRNVQ